MSGCPIPDLMSLEIVVYFPKRRLRGRRTESEDSLQRRLSTAKSEVVYGQTPGNFDATIVNDDLDAAVDKLESIVVKLIADGRAG